MQNTGQKTKKMKILLKLAENDPKMLKAAP